jgi:hypothetical protein
MTSFESITQAGTALAVIISAIFQFVKTQKLAKVAEDTKAEVKVVKVLVDGSLSSEYQISATSARTLAEVTHKSDHIMLADQAELRLKDHLAKMGAEKVKEN